MFIQERAEEKHETMVDALDEGAIVRVPESYARREGLPILRKWMPPPMQKTVSRLGPKETGGMDTFRRPLKKDAGGIREALLDNFHWVLSHRRKGMNLSRKQLAQAVGASEYDIKLLENGVLPAHDFVLISALERYCGISLRKDGPASAPPAATLRPARSFLAGGNVPRFGAAERAEERPSAHREMSETNVLSSEDLLGTSVELEDEEL